MILVSADIDRRRRRPRAFHARLFGQVGRKAGNVIVIAAVDRPTFRLQTQVERSGVRQDALFVENRTDDEFWVETDQVVSAFQRNRAGNVGFAFQRVVQRDDRVAKRQQRRRRSVNTAADFRLVAANRAIRKRQRTRIGANAAAISRRKPRYVRRTAAYS